MTHEFAFEAHPTPEQIQYLERPALRVQLGATGIRDGEWLAIFVKDERGFETLCAVDDFPRGHQSLMLRKRLSA